MAHFTDADYMQGRRPECAPKRGSRNDPLGEANVGINKAVDAGAAHGQIRSTDALRRVLPTRLTSHL